MHDSVRTLPVVSEVRDVVTKKDGRNVLEVLLGGLLSIRLFSSLLIILEYYIELDSFLLHTTYTHPSGIRMQSIGPSAGRTEVWADSDWLLTGRFVDE